MNVGLKPVWAGRNMRLDPFRLPQAVSYATCDDFGDVTFLIDRRGATVRRHPFRQPAAGDRYPARQCLQGRCRARDRGRGRP
jgi:hypothetical protein